MQKILIATKNPGKVLEYRELITSGALDISGVPPVIKALPFEVVILKDSGVVDEPEEDQPTF